MLALKMGIAYAIPDTPAWVEKEMAKIEYRRRELEKSIGGSTCSSTASPIGSYNNSMDTEDRGIQTEEARNGDAFKGDLPDSCSRYNKRL